MTAAATPFDAMAASYDAGFSRTPLGGRLRAAAWRHFDASFASGMRLLELGCGTGEDALHLAAQGTRLVATDASAAMVDEARRKVDAAGLGASVETRVLSFEGLAAAAPSLGTFDGAFSNFGALNCTGDLPALAHALGGLLRPGAPLLLVVMGPFVPWEWGWFLAHGQPRKAARRFSPGGVAWRGLTLHYPTPGGVARAFAPSFRRTATQAVGALLPPTDAEPWIRQRPALLDRLDRWGRRVEAVFPFPWLSDHYLLRLERT